MAKRTIKEIKEAAIKGSYIAIEKIEKVLTQDIDLEDLDPEKAKAAVQGKLEAQSAIFAMVNKIQEEQSAIDAMDNKTSEKQKRVNKSNDGFAESRSK